MEELKHSLKPLPPKKSLNLEKKQAQKTHHKEKQAQEEIMVTNDNQMDNVVIPKLLQWILQKISGTKKNNVQEPAPKLVTRPTIAPNAPASPTPFNTRPTPQLKIVKDKELAVQKARQEDIARQNQLKKDLLARMIEQNKKLAPKPSPKPQGLKPSPRPENPFVKAAQKQQSKQSSYTQQHGNDLMHVQKLERGL